MGGYAAYVWPAYGLAAVVLVGLLVTGLRQLRTVERRLAAAEARRGATGRKAST